MTIPSGEPRTAPPTAAELLDHIEWIRDLARRLVRDPGTADDVAQETWLAATLSAPPRVGRMRAWLAQITRNRARHAARTRARSRVRESIAAKAESIPSTDDLVDRASRHREVVDRVLELDEPFRSTVLLRYFDDLTPPAIAAKLGVPLKTVHSRLARAHERMRVRLDTEFGDRRRWQIALAPLAAGAPQTLLPATSTSTFASAGAKPKFLEYLLMTSNAKWFVACAVLFLGGFGLWRFGTVTPSLAVEDVSGHAAPRELAAADVGPVDEIRATGERVAAEQEERLIPAPQSKAEEQMDAAGAATCTIHGMAVDVRGQPIAGVRVTARTFGTSGGPGQGQSTTTEAGEFSLAVPDPRSQEAHGPERPSGQTVLRVEEDDWITLRAARVSTTSIDLVHIVVVAKTTELEGHVVDTSGAAIEGASVHLSTRSDAFLDFPLPLDLTSHEPLWSTTDTGGRFIFARFPSVRGTWLRVTATDYVPKLIKLDTEARPYVCTLVRPTESNEKVLAGIVVGSDGHAIEDAEVRLNASKTRTAPDGSFRLAFGKVTERTPLCASAQGHLAALIPNFGEVIARADGRPADVELVLGGPPLAIAGRLVDDDGDPLADWQVSIADETEVSQWSVPIVSAESLARTSAEVVITDDTGRFRLEGLYPRGYRVQALDPVNLLRAERVLQAGDHKAILVADGSLCGPVTGRIIDSRGNPRAGVRLALGREKASSETGYTTLEGRTMITGEDGAFTFDLVPLEGIFLGLSGEEILYSRYDFERPPDAKEHVITVLMRCHLRIQLNDPGTADKVRFLDASGEAVQISKFQAGGMSASMSMSLVDGKTPTVTVTELASTIVLMKEGQDVSRHPVDLDPDEVSVLRF